MFTHDATERARLADSLLPRLANSRLYGPMAFSVTDPLLESHFALSADGTPLVMALVAVDGEVARLSAFVAAKDEEATWARYLLARDLFVALIDRGVRHVIAEKALSAPEGADYFSRRLGFELKRVRVTTEHP